MQVYVGDSCHRPGMQQQQHPQGGGGGGGGGGGQWGNGGGFGSAGGTGSMGGGGNGAGMGGSAPTMIHKTMANVTILGEYDGGEKGLSDVRIVYVLWDLDVCPFLWRLLARG